MVIMAIPLRDVGVRSGQLNAQPVERLSAENLFAPAPQSRMDGEWDERIWWALPA